MNRLARALTSALFALVVCLWASSAFAAAPICDDRGASAFAPPPTLDTPNASVDLGLHDNACERGADRDAGLRQGGAPEPRSLSATPDLVPSDASVTVACAPVALQPRPRPVLGARAGARARLERPPR